MIDATIYYMPIILGLIDSPEFFRGEPDTLQMIFDLAHEAGEQLMVISGQEKGFYLCNPTQGRD